METYVGPLHIYKSRASPTVGHTALTHDQFADVVARLPVAEWVIGSLTYTGAAEPNITAVLPDRFDTEVWRKRLDRNGRVTSSPP